MRSWLALCLCCWACVAWSSEEAALKAVEIGSDQPTLERGAETVLTVCMGCHSLKYVHFRDLEKLGIAKDKIDGWRGNNPMGSVLLSSMPVDAAIASFGKAPPDLSLMARAREGEAAYVYSYLLGYYMTPEGNLGNHYFSTTKMPDALGIATATDAAQRAEIEGKARDVASFLMWAADPHAGERKTLGYYVIGYLVLFTSMLYLLKRRIWSRLDKE
jgi:ubiquinol-cytochrome c reductase cytochrome c1 subunit